jgi:hypothetical protein
MAYWMARTKRDTTRKQAVTGQDEYNSRRGGGGFHTHDLIDGPFEAVLVKGDTEHGEANHDGKVHSAGEALQDAVLAEAGVVDSGDEPCYPKEAASSVSLMRRDEEREGSSTRSSR